MNGLSKRKKGAERLRGTVLRQLSALTKMTMPELQEKWLELYGTEPISSHRHHLIRRLAYRIQEMYYGGLEEGAKQQLAEIAQHDPLACVTRATGKKAAASQLTPGTRFIRRWRGVEYEVIVVEGGFEYNKCIYRSLTAVAKAITGSKWNGRAFFGLPKQETGTRRRTSGKDGK